MRQVIESDTLDSICNLPKTPEWLRTNKRSHGPSGWSIFLIHYFHKYRKMNSKEKYIYDRQQKRHDKEVAIINENDDDEDDKDYTEAEGETKDLSMELPPSAGPRTAYERKKDRIENFKLCMQKVGSVWHSLGVVA